MTEATIPIRCQPLRRIGSLGPPIQRVAELHDKRPECADGDKDCEEVRPSAQAKTVTDHDLLTVPVELVRCGVDPEQGNAVNRDRPNVVWPARWRSHG